MATANAAEVFLDLQSWIDPGMSALLDHNLPHLVPIPLADVFTIPEAQLTAGAITRFLKFPPGAYIWQLRGTPSDMDSDGTPAVTYTLVTTNDADVTQNTLVTSSTNAQAAAGSDSLAAGAVGKYVGGQWLSFKVGTAPDVAVAGTYKLALMFTVGVLNREKRGVYLGDAGV